MALCDACKQLREISQRFEIFGIENTECNSLKNNTGLNPNLSPKHDNCEDIGLMNDCLIAMFKEKLGTYDDCSYKEAISDMLENIYQMNKALLCSDCGQWEQIALIWEEIRKIWLEIENIYKLINSIQGGNYTWLTPGVDYTCIFFNGWYTYPDGPSNENYIRVGYIETNQQIQIRTQSPINVNGYPTDYFRLYNDDLIANGFTQRHSTPVADAPSSWIVGINFIGTKSAWNNYSWLNNTAEASGIWNLRPTTVELRTSWHANCPISNNVSGSNCKLLHSCTQYADGLNIQFTTYGLPSLQGNGINMTGDGILFKPTT